jgi:hypothetical protein
VIGDEEVVKMWGGESIKQTKGTKNDGETQGKTKKKFMYDL